jgi:hypothetical protein
MKLKKNIVTIIVLIAVVVWIVFMSGIVNGYTDEINVIKK